MKIRAQYVDVRITVLGMTPVSIAQHCARYSGTLLAFFAGDDVRPIPQAVLRFPNLWRATDCCQASFFLPGELARFDARRHQRQAAHAVSP